MKYTRTPLLIATLFSTSAFIGLPAQSTQVAQVVTTVPDFTKSLADAVAIRSGLVDSIVSGSATPTTALSQLQASASPMGQLTSTAAELGFAATDIGCRLLGKGKPVEAGAFFKAAETALALIVSQTADALAYDKARYLQGLAMVRGKYLGNVAQAKLDIEQAIALQPDDKYLQIVRDNLARENAEIFKPSAKN